MKNKLRDLFRKVYVGLVLFLSVCALCFGAPQVDKSRRREDESEMVKQEIKDNG